MLCSIRNLIALLFLAFLAACGGHVPPVAEMSATPPVYRLGAGDKIRITVFGEEALSREYSITSAGILSFPLIGEVKAAGQSPTELGADLTKRLSAGYLNDPRVSIEMMGYRPFYILGEVERAGEFPYVTDLSALQAVALAGGYTYRADRRRLFIRRAGETEERTYRLDGRPVWILPGDTIRVGERYL
jgi:protein involved in polysaccharide export with SLBB domain